MKIRKDFLAQRDIYETDLGRPVLSKKEFISELKDAIINNRPYAAGRTGISEQFWMYYPIMLKEAENKSAIRVFEKHLRFHGYWQAGIFPASPGFFLEYNDFYILHLRAMNCLGMVLEPVMGPKIIRFYDFSPKLLFFQDLVPDKSVPDNPENCYLQYFFGKKILLICPFAGVLKSRATREIFEGVWSKTGKKWFFPESVEDLEFPYGFEDKTQRQYSSAIALFEYISREIGKRDFDIALVAAAGLSVPIASRVKSLGRICIALGGDLQILFGVLGKRWRERKAWKEKYFNEWWIDMPEKYKPASRGACDEAYW
jgi:hypothetical protein